MGLPAVLNRKYFSASIMNEYSRSLLTSFAWAVAPRAPFAGLFGANSGTGIWTGFILYTGDTDTFRYRLNHTTSGTSTIKMNGSTIATPSGTGIQAGTVSIAGLGLTPGTVYSVTLDATGQCDPQWLGLSKTPSYTAPPTFSSGAVLTAAQLNTLRSGLGELEQAWAMPHTPNILGRRGAPGPGNGSTLDGSELVVWRGWFYHAHNTLRYRFRHGINNKTVHTKIYYNSVGVLDTGDTTHDITRAGTVALSGLTAGTIYECKVTLYRSGTSNSLRGFCWVYEMGEESSGSATPPPVWAHGGTNVTHTNLNRYGTIINAIHPGAASPSAPLYYEQPALKTEGTSYRYYIQHRRKWLRYRVRIVPSGKTPEMEYGPNLEYKYALDNSVGNHSFDLTTLPRGMGLGQYYVLEDSEFACEYDTAQS